jgi:F0F1-type ATP synthase assembly protein I
LGVLVGLVVGAAMGYVQDHMAVWTGIGAATGIIVGFALDRYKPKAA